MTPRRRSTAAMRTRRLRVTRPRLADLSAGAIAINAAGADVDEALRYNPRFCQRGDQPCGARIIAAVAGRRRKVQHREGRQTQPAETAQLIEVARDRRDAVISQLRNVLRPARETIQPHVGAQKIGGSNSDVAATY